MILAMMPYDPKKNLGRAYNAAMALLPENGWGVLLDHDILFTTKNWWNQIASAIEQYPDACFTGVTNRIGNGRTDEARRAEGRPEIWQRIPTRLGMMTNHDVIAHRRLGEQMLKNTTLRDVSNEPWSWCGFIMILSKKAWLKAGKFQEKERAIPGPDRTMWAALRREQIKVYLIEGLYLYHLWRGDGSAHPWDYKP